MISISFLNTLLLVGNYFDLGLIALIQSRDSRIGEVEIYIGVVYTIVYNSKRRDQISRTFYTQQLHSHFYFNYQPWEQSNKMFHIRNLQTDCQLSLRQMWPITARQRFADPPGGDKRILPWIFRGSVNCGHERGNGNL